MNNYIRIAIFGIDEVLLLIPNIIDIEKTLKGNIPDKDFKKRITKTFIVRDIPIKVKMGSLRYKVFHAKGTKCTACGLEGKYFALERFQNCDSCKAHFNLYGILHGAEVLITKDHILPKSRGGKDHISNLQTMCITCNTLKGNNL